MLSWGRATILPFCPGLLSGPGGWCWHMSGRLSLPDPRILSANSRDQARCKRIRKLRTKKVSTCFHSKIDLGGEMYGNVDVWTHFCIPPKNSVHCVDPSQTHGCQSHEIAYKSMHSSWQSTLCQWTFDHWINLGPKLDKPRAALLGLFQENHTGAARHLRWRLHILCFLFQGQLLIYLCLDWPHRWPPETVSWGPAPPWPQEIMASGASKTLPIPCYGWVPHQATCHETGLVTEIHCCHL